MPVVMHPLQLMSLYSPNVNTEHPLLSLLPNASSLHLSPFGIIRLLYHVYSIRGAMQDKIIVLYGVSYESTGGSLIKD